MASGSAYVSRANDDLRRGRSVLGGPDSAELRLGRNRFSFDSWLPQPLDRARQTSAHPLVTADHRSPVHTPHLLPAASAVDRPTSGPRPADGPSLHEGMQDLR
jgi:hypothetical protein